MNALMQFFNYEHLPEPMKSVSKKFGDLAAEMNDHLPENPEKTVMLRKLLEAKDCAVRAMIFKEASVDGSEEKEAVDNSDEKSE